MRFFRKMKKEEKESSISQIETKGQDIDFTDSMFSDIAEMKLRLENIKSEQEICEELKSLIDSFEKYIEKSSQIIEERKIEEQLRRINESNIILELETSPQIPQSVYDRANQELTIEEYYKNIKTVYEAKYNRAKQSILMKKAEKFNNDMDKVLFGKVDFDTINLGDVKEIKTYYEILKQKNQEFTGIMQNKYVEKLVELQYKINIIYIIKNRIFLGTHDLMDNINELIKESQTTKSKQTIWARLFINGVENLMERANNEYTQKLKSDIDKINLKDNKEEILNKDVIAEYVKGIVQIQLDKIAEEQRQKIQETKEKEELEKEQEEQRKKEELEKMARISESEIQEKIKELDDDKFDIVTSYKSIIDYQIEIAKAKGLINDRNILKIDDITITRTERGMIPLILANLEDQILNCEIYTDVDDSKNNVYVITPKGEEINLSIDNDYGYVRNGMSFKQVTDSFFQVYKEYETKTSEYKIVQAKKGNSMYYYNTDILMAYVKKLVNQYKKDNDENSKKVKFYIEIPYRRTIIPILEQLQQNEIEFTIPPTDEETKMNEPTVRIYMDRIDLEKYIENVHKNISTIDKGIVKIGEEEIHIDEILIEGCDFPSLKDKQKEQKQPE